LLWEIDKVSFAIVEMTLYLDTHPNEKEAIDYLNHYNRKKRQLMKEYAMKFTPLTVECAQDNDCEHWKWALDPLPWKGGNN